jgi:hypothetical protein
MTVNDNIDEIEIRLRAEKQFNQMTEVQASA